MTGEVITGNEGFFRPKEALKIEPPAELEFTGHAGVIREFLDCLEKGTEPQTVCTDNIKSLAMVHAAVESAETGKKIQIKY